MKMMKLKIVAVTLLGLVFVPSTVLADNFTSDPVIGNTSVTFTGTPAADGGLTLDSVPSYIFPTMPLNFSGETMSIQIPSSIPFKTTDYRGSELGYQVTAEASGLKIASGKTLPVQKFEMLVLSEAEAGITGKSEVDVYQKSDTVLTSDGSYVGTINGVYSAVTLVVAKNGIKAQTYTGTINYTLIEDIQ
ncbi:MAG: hypothetical protein LBM95_01360 [Lactobacillales bacterium]|nr:hypothetical protein [Lactobacillales bacterium]